MRRTVQHYNTYQHIIDRIRSYASEVTKTSNNASSIEDEDDKSAAPFNHMDTMSNNGAYRYEDFNRDNEDQHSAFWIKFDYTSGDPKVNHQSIPEPSRSISNQPGSPVITSDRLSSLPISSEFAIHTQSVNKIPTLALPIKVIKTLAVVLSIKNEPSLASSWTTMCRDNIINSRSVRKTDANLFQMTLVLESVVDDAVKSITAKELIQLVGRRTWIHQCQAIRTNALQSDLNRHGQLEKTAPIIEHII